MKEQHKASYGLNARATLQMLKIAIGQDFHTLSRSHDYPFRATFGFLMTIGLVILMIAESN